MCVERNTAALDRLDSETYDQRSSVNEVDITRKQPPNALSE